MRQIRKNKPIILAFVLCLLWPAMLHAALRERVGFDFDWKFILNDSLNYKDHNYIDKQWDDVQLPHDWNIEQEFVTPGDGSAAFLPDGIAWYRKSFETLPGWCDKRISIMFDGIFMQSDVWINGHHLGHRPYGFCSIEYDLTPWLHRDGTPNIIAVRVNTTGGRPRWYGGAGIYRHAWLNVTGPVHVDTYGTYVTTPNISNNRAVVDIATTVANDGIADCNVIVEQRVIDNSGKKIAETRSQLLAVASGSKSDVTQSMCIDDPNLWDVDNPVLYTVETEIKSGRRTVDRYVTSFGIRSFVFDSDSGFSLNGRRLKLQGVCLHQDAGALGNAVPDRAYERRLQMLKEYGANAVRCAHNPPSPEFLMMCDTLGLLVIDEAFDKWKSGYYEKYFDQWWQADLSDMLLRDRNHPSIILWSIGNELQEAWSDGRDGVERAAMLQDFVHKIEPTRPVTLAAQNNHQDKFSGVTDVIGYNYLEARAISDHLLHPERRFLISEELPYYSGEEGNIRSYSTVNPWNYVRENDFFAGGFIWSGIDYLGEASWPSRGWPNGLFDITMTEKPRAAYHRSQWNSEPMVHIAIPQNEADIDHGRDLWQWPPMVSHWNLPDSYRELVVPVWTVTNCEEVELYINGKLIGRKATADFPNNTIVWNVCYTPGEIEARGYNNGHRVAVYNLMTSGPAFSAILSPDRPELVADGQDLCHVFIDLVDSEGRKVSTDDRVVTASVSGNARIVALENGDLRRGHPFGSEPLPTYFGRALAVVQALRTPGDSRLKIEIEGIDKPFYIDLKIKQTKK